MHSTPKLHLFDCMVELVFSEERSSNNKREFGDPPQCTTIHIMSLLSV
jgi:hypothetical protein